MHKAGEVGDDFLDSGVELGPSKHVVDENAVAV